MNVDFEQCKKWHKIHIYSQGWMIGSFQGYICQFTKVCDPIDINFVRIKKTINSDVVTFEYVYCKKYFRGSWPRHLDNKEQIVEQKGGFATLRELLDHLAST